MTHTTQTRTTDTNIPATPDRPHQALRAEFARPLEPSPEMDARIKRLRAEGKPVGAPGRGALRLDLAQSAWLEAPLKPAPTEPSCEDLAVATSAAQWLRLSLGKALGAQEAYGQGRTRDRAQLLREGLWRLPRPTSSFTSETEPEADLVWAQDPTHPMSPLWLMPDVGAHGPLRLPRAAAGLPGLLQALGDHPAEWTSEPAGAEAFEWDQPVCATLYHPQDLLFDHDTSQIHLPSSVVQTNWTQAEMMLRESALHLSRSPQQASEIELRLDETGGALTGRLRAITHPGVSFAAVCGRVNPSDPTLLELDVDTPYQLRPSALGQPSRVTVNGQDVQVTVQWGGLRLSTELPF